MSIEEKIKNHWTKYKWWYIGIGSAVTLVGLGYYIGKNYQDSDLNLNQPLENHIENSPNAIINSLPYGVLNYTVEAGRQGPPSWVVKCIETGDVFSSQQKAAESLGISPSLISGQLNGISSDANGYHFERICLAA